MITMKYQNHLGASVDLNANGIVSNVSDVAEWSMSSSTVGGRVSSLSADSDDIEFSCATYSNEARSRLYDIPSVDVEAMVPGRLYVGEWYLVCYVTAASQSGGADRSGIAKYSITVTPDDPHWRRDTETIATERHDGGNGLDYEYDYLHDYGYAPTTVVVENKSYLKADLIIRAYGPCSSPLVKIAGNEYGAGVELNQGDYLQIDTYEKTVKVVRLDGDVENAFPDITGEYREGSGSYIFQKVKHGQAEVIWPGTYDLDVVMVERVNEPRWWD